MFTSFRIKTNRVGTSVLLTAMLALSVSATVANAKNDAQPNKPNKPNQPLNQNTQNQNNPFINQQPAVIPQDRTAFVDFKDQVIVVPCLLIKGFELIGDNVFYRVKLKQQRIQQGNAADWKVIEATPAPECITPDEPPVIDDQPTTTGDGTPTEQPVTNTPPIDQPTT